MQPLIDGDVLRYEIGFAAEAAWRYEGKEGLPPWERVEVAVDMLIANICAAVEATCPAIIYFTGKHNFRYDIAKRNKYKDRASNKPFHYYNITAYLKGKYQWCQEEGLEADDLMAIEQTRREDILNGNPFYTGPLVRSIICTRDKDLRHVPGWHYGWELGNQPSFGPELVDELGYLKLLVDEKNKKKLVGTGMLFFYAQCLTGDPTDSIPGIPKLGAVKAFNTLDGCVCIKDGLKRVLEAYRAVYGDMAEVELLEQGRLLHMTRKLNEDGTPVLWEINYDYLQSDVQLEEQVLLRRPSEVLCNEEAG